MKDYNACVRWSNIKSPKSVLRFKSDTETSSDQLKLEVLNLSSKNEYQEAMDFQ